MASASRWVSVSSAGDKTIDAESLVRDGRFVSLWFKGAVEPGFAPGVTTVLDRMRFDCAANTFTLTDFVWYDAAGSIVKRQQGVVDKPEAVIPDTTADDVRQIVCAKP